MVFSLGACVNCYVLVRFGWFDGVAVVTVWVVAAYVIVLLLFGFIYICCFKLY